MRPVNRLHKKIEHPSCPHTGMARTIFGCSANSVVFSMYMVTLMVCGFPIAGFAMQKRIIPMNTTSGTPENQSQKRCDGSIESGTNFMSEILLLPPDFAGQENNSGLTTVLKPKSSQASIGRSAEPVPTRYCARFSPLVSWGRPIRLQAGSLKRSPFCHHQSPLFLNRHPIIQAKKIPLLNQIYPSLTPLTPNFRSCSFHRLILILS